MMSSRPKVASLIDRLDQSRFHFDSIDKRNMDSIRRNNDTAPGEERDPQYGPSSRRNTSWGSNWARESKPERDTLSTWRNQTPANIPVSTQMHSPTIEAQETWSSDQPRVHSLEEIAPGSIIRALHVFESLGSSQAESTEWSIRPNSTKLNFDTTRSVRYKLRYWVVIKVFPGLFTAVPLLTKCGKGLENVPESERNNYMSIKDMRTDTFDNQNENMPVLETGEMFPDAETLHPKSVVMHNGVATHFGHHPIQLKGALTAYSTAVLLKQITRFEWEPVEEPSTALTHLLEAKLRATKAPQQDFLDELARNPSYGTPLRNGNRPQTISQPNANPKTLLWRRSSSDSELQVRTLFSGGKERTPSRPTFRNSFSALIEEEDGSEGSASDKQETE